MVVLHCAAMLRFSVATVYDCRAQDCFFLRLTAGRIAYWWFAFSAFCLLSVRLQAILHVVIIFERAAPTAADPKEKLPSESVRGCPEKLLKASADRGM